MAKEMAAKSQALFQGYNSLGVVRGGVDAAGMLANQKAGGDYRIERIADLKRIIAGESTDDKRSRQREMMQYLEQVDQARLDTLKSMSVGRKVVMLADGRSDRFRRMRQMDAEWELAELEDNLFKFPWSGAT